MYYCRHVCCTLYVFWTLVRYIEGFSTSSSVMMKMQKNEEVVMVDHSGEELAAASTTTIMSKTLAGDYVIECGYVHNHKCIWWFTPLQNDGDDINPVPGHTTPRPSSGLVARTAVHSTENFFTTSSKSFCLCCIVDRLRSRIDVTIKTNNSISSRTQDLLSMIALIQVQLVLTDQTIVDSLSTAGTGSQWELYLPNDPDHPLRISTLVPIVDQFMNCFGRFITSSSDLDEIVEMVTVDGQPLGRIPRTLVHKHNLLHRGIGLFVTQDKPLLVGTNSDVGSLDTQPNLYVHRRTNNKRIFPAMYDMFIGGVSMAGEDSISTAHRELEEELGLNNDRHWVGNTPLFNCLVCTAYNRCVVDVFSYTMKTTEEHIQWQQEEVAWGSFVPNSIVQAAADLSIQRLASHCEWPGSYPPIQSTKKGKSQEQADFPDNAAHWSTWDFVPDGLLVWEAWLRNAETHS